MPTSGLLFATSKIKNPELSDDIYNKWYNDIHLPDVLATGCAPIALRYKNKNKDAKMPYLALYPLDDLALLESEKFKNIPLTSDVLPGGGEAFENIEFAIRTYLPIQKFEGQIEKSGRGNCIICVAMEPAEGTDEEFDEWYRKQHLDMLSMVRGYRRTTRYKLAPGNDSSLPRYLALHEYDDSDVPGDQLKLVVGTEWSKKIIGEAKAFDRDVYELVKEAGKTGAKL
ncbi:hypothetical protein B0A49_09097 [Cryomyces minteri]|uniref:EthD domain-containing protein n=1 Tax=Cryomyces minteri TaxID=331657 RepID=A0A4U0WID6_9PEZI|nr:hypothetical protein B0A49_09097 [Cryomyces minteri]